MLNESPREVDQFNQHFDFTFSSKQNKKYIVGFKVVFFENVILSFQKCDISF